MQKLDILPAITSAQSQSLSVSCCSQPESKIKEKLSQQNISSTNNNNIFQKPRPIGIYNFCSNKTSITSLEQNIDEAVSLFIEKNKENIIQCVVQEVEKKFEEKIKPMTEEISDLKNDFNSLYEEEWNDFKQSNILNDCHNNIMELNNKMNIMNENINIYNENIKGFNVADNRLQFLNKLNKDLDVFITGISHEIRVHNLGGEGFDMDTVKNLHKIEKEMNKQENLNNELDSVFHETMEMLNDITKEEKNEKNKNIIENNNNMMNCSNILNNFKNAINTFETKFNYDKPMNNNSIGVMNINNINNHNKNEQKNFIENIPNFFDTIY